MDLTGRTWILIPMDYRPIQFYDFEDEADFGGCNNTSSGEPSGDASVGLPSADIVSISLTLGISYIYIGICHKRNC